MGQLIKFPKKSVKPKGFAQPCAIVSTKKKKIIATGTPAGTLLFFTGTRYQRHDKALPGS